MKHKGCVVKDLKPEVLQQQGSQVVPRVEGNSSSPIHNDIDPSCDLTVNDLTESNVDSSDLNDMQKNIELKVASLLLKLEHVYLVSSVVVDELLQELDNLKHLLRFHLSTRLLYII